MQPNKLMAATIAVTASAGLAFSPIASAEETPPAPTGQHGFFVPGHGGSDDPQNYVHPDIPFPIHFVDNGSGGFSTLDVSTAAGVANLITSIKENAAPHENFGDFVHLTCYGVGCVVVHKTKPAFQDGGELQDYELFEVTTFRDPSNADGGLLTKMPFDLPGFTRVNQDDYTDATHEQTITYRYDLVSDAPDRPGLLAFANAFAAAMYYGDDYGYQQLTDAIADDRVVTTVTTNEDGSTRTHYLVDDPDRGLPLTKLFRDIGLAFNNDAGDEKVHQFWDGIDNVLQPHIDNKYDTGADPEVNQREVNTVNGVPTAPVEEVEDENVVVNQVAEQSSFSNLSDDQDVNRSSAPVDNGTPPANANPGDSGNAASNSTVGEPDKKPTWKERRAERKAEREAAREERKAERAERREQFNQNVNNTIDSVRDALNPKKDDSPSDGEGEGNGNGSKDDNSDGSGGPA